MLKHILSRCRFLPLLLAAVAALAAHCADYERPPKPDAPANGIVLIAGSDFATGFLSAIDPVSYKVYRDIVPIHSDSTLRYDQANTATLVLQRLGADSLRRLENTTGYTNSHERSLGARSNPQEVEILPNNLAAISLYNSNALQIVNRSNGAVVHTIDLSAYADADGYAEIGALRYAAGDLFVAVQRLDRLAAGAIWPPVGQSYLLRINITNWQVTSYAVPFTNPARIHHQTARNSLIFAAPGRFAANYTLDGGCVEFSLASYTFVTSPISEVQAGYDIADCDIKADGSGIFVGYDSALGSVFGSFDSAAHSVTRVAAYLASSNGGYFPGFLLHSSGKVFLSDRNIFNPGLRVFSGPTLTEIGGQTFYTGLPPYTLEEIP